MAPPTVIGVTMGDNAFINWTPSIDVYIGLFTINTFFVENK
jgi:hypothetical protein